jgi:hypothetical protein
MSYGRRCYVIVVAVTVIAVITEAILISQRTTEIQLGTDYKVDEKNVYTTILT